MTAVVAWFEAIFSSIPLPLLEVWGRFAYIVGLLLAICAFGGFHVSDRGALGIRSGAADLGCEGLP